jgi:septation ring formation regulator EzrA
MSIENRRQLENTRAKVQMMEELYERKRREPADDEHVRELTLRSLKKRINQFKEEMIRFECRVRSVKQDG